MFVSWVSLLTEKDKHFGPDQQLLEDGRHVSTSSHCAKMKTKYLGYKCAVTDGGVRKLPDCESTTAVNHDVKPAFYSIKYMFVSTLSSRQLQLFHYLDHVVTLVTMKKSSLQW